VTNVICNTSPFQHFHQIDQLLILPALAGKIIVPPAVVDDLAAGRVAGMNLPDLSQLD
jgi:predicted nucleic acid-binding protein